MFLITIIIFFFQGREETPSMPRRTKIFRETFLYCCSKYVAVHKDPAMLTFASPGMTSQEQKASVKSAIKV